ncbi:hypothetical protein MBLNU230_g4155t1 [Neophaeotheca triangularis]
MPPFRDDQILIIAPGSHTTLAQLGLPESFTPARYKIRSRMFHAEKSDEYEPVKIRRKEKNPEQQNGSTDPAESSKPEPNDELEWEEDRISEEGAVWPIKDGQIVNWNCFYALMTHVYNTVNPPFHTPVLLISEPVWTPKEHERVTQFFFEKFKIPAFGMMDSAMAAVYAYGVPTATVVDVGFTKADITCVTDFVLQNVGRGLAVPDCGGEALTERLVELLGKRKGFTRDVCEQLKRSNICEILSADDEMPTAEGAEAPANPASKATTGAEGPGATRRESHQAGLEQPRGPGADTEAGDEQQLEDEEGVLDIASIVTGGNMSEYLAQKEREKAEKAAARQQKKGADANAAGGPKPVRLPNAKRTRNTFMYEDFALHDAMKAAGMGNQGMADMQSALEEGPNKRQRTPEPQSAVSDKPADAGVPTQVEGEAEVAPQHTPSTGGILRREIEVGPERFQAASGGILDSLADAIHFTVQSCPELSKRSELWDNLVFLGNGSRVRGFKDALLQRLQAKYLISPSSATIFTSELPSNLSTPMGTGAQTPQQQMPGQQPQHGGVNPLLLAATTAQNPHLNPGQQAMYAAHSSSGHGQTPTSMKVTKIPDYFPEWKELGYDEAHFLGAQVAAKVLFVVDGGGSKGFMTRTDYNEQGPRGVHEVAL